MRTSRRAVILVVVGILIAALVGVASPSAAEASTDPSGAAIAWAEGYLGTAKDPGGCLLFVAQAYAAAGVDVGSSTGAAQYWQQNPKGYTEHPGDTSPPRGALVFWGATPSGPITYPNPYGHVGIFLGSNTVISTTAYPETSSNPNVFEFPLTGPGSRNAVGYPYLGWLAPPGVGATSGYPEGSFVRVNETGEIYRMAGGAPVYVSTWTPFGGSQPVANVSQAQLNAMPAYPRDGTFLNGGQSGTVYRVAGGAPEGVSTWNSFGGPQPTVTVDQAAIDMAGGAGAWSHLRAVPLDGTFISNTADGRTYRVAGGAPLYVSTWNAFGGSQPTTSLDPYEFVSYQHLRPYPADVFLRGTGAGRIFRVVAGHPMYVPSWTPYGGTQPSVDVDDWPSTIVTI